MYKGIQCECNKEKCFFDTNTTRTHVITPTNTIELLNDTITNIYTKDSSSGEYPYLIKIAGNECIIVAFKSLYLRDFYKSFYTCIIKENADNKNPEIVKSLQQQVKEQIATYAENAENTKMQMVKFVIDKPVLLNIFNEMNCTMTQFFNYLRQSYFCNMANPKNVIDRLLNEKTREFKNCEDNFATRINTHSFLQLTDELEVDVTKKEILYNEVDFMPIFAKTEENKCEKLNDFEIPDNISLTVDFEYKTEHEDTLKVYDKKILKRLVELCRKMYNTDSKNTEDINAIFNEAHSFRTYLEDPHLQSFDPSNYVRK